MLKNLIGVLRKSSNINSNAHQSLVFAIIKYIAGNKRKATPILLEYFKKNSETIEFRIFLGDLLSAINPDATKATFKQILADPNQAVSIRARSAYYLGFSKGQDIPNFLAALISDSGQAIEIRADAIAGLTVYFQHSPYLSQTQQGVLPALTIAINSGNEKFNMLAARAFGYLHSRDSLMPLLDALNSENKDVRRQAILASAEAGITDNQLIQKLIELHNTDSYNQAPIIKTFGALKVQEAIPLLRRHLTERTDEYGMCLAAIALAEIGGLDSETIAAIKIASETAKDSFGKKEIIKAYKKIVRR